MNPIPLKRGALFTCPEYKAGIIIQIRKEGILAAVLCYHPIDTREWCLRTRVLPFETRMEPINVSTVPRVASAALVHIWRSLSLAG